MNHVILINQPAGLGDIFFLQKAVKSFADAGASVIWPIEDNFTYLSDYISHPNILYCSKNNDFEYKEIYNLNSQNTTRKIIDSTVVDYVPFVHAEHSIRCKLSLERSAMKCKYKFALMDFVDWSDYFTFQRNHEREHNLRIRYGIKENEDFIFINNLFASPPNMLIRDMQIKTDLKVVYNDGSPCHIFDFCWLFEHAKEIHTIESAFCYIIEKLNTTDKLFMYSRKVNGRQQHPNFEYIEGIHKKFWIKIYD